MDKKKMYLIKVVGRDSNLWTDSYFEKDGFIKFTVKTKKGDERKFEMNKSQISEISEQEVDDNDLQ